MCINYKLHSSLTNALYNFYHDNCCAPVENQYSLESMHKRFHNKTLVTEIIVLYLSCNLVE